MKNMRTTFKIFEGLEQELPPGFQKIDCHIIFDVELSENYKRKE
jgi:hypothetical protein